MKNNKILKVGQINNSLKLKARSLKRQLISRFQLLIIYMHKIVMINKNNKGRSARNASPARSRYSVSGERSDAGWGEKNNSVVGRPKIGGMARKVAVAGVMGMLAVGLLWDARGVGAARSKKN